MWPNNRKLISQKHRLNGEQVDNEYLLISLRTLFGPSRIRIIKAVIPLAANCRTAARLLDLEFQHGSVAFLGGCKAVMYFRYSLSCYTSGLDSLLLGSHLFIYRDFYWRCTFRVLACLNYLCWFSHFMESLAGYVNF